MRAESEGILKQVEQSLAVGFDETHWNDDDDGRNAYVNVAVP